MTIIEIIIQDAKLVPKTLRYKIYHKMELIEAELEGIYNSNNPKLAYLCAEYIPKVNIAKLEKAVLSDPYYSYMFAKNILGTDKVKLEDAVLNFPYYSYYFAKCVPGANKEKLEESIKKDDLWWNKYKLSGFAF